MSWQQHVIVVFMYTINKTSRYLKIMAALFIVAYIVFTTHDQELYVEEFSTLKIVQYANS